MTPLERKRRNRELARMGLRVCRIHGGDPLPLTDAYFYRRESGFDTACKRCKNAANAARMKARYHHDPVYHAQRDRQQRADRARHLIARRSSNARRQAAYRNSPVKYGGLQPIPPGLAVVAYDPARTRLRRFDAAGKLRLTVPCTAQAWARLKGEYQRAGYWPVPEWTRYDVLARFEGTR